MELQGYWYNGKESTQQAAVIRVGDHGHFDVLINASQGKTESVFSDWVSQLRFSSRLGNTSRYIYFPDGQKFETKDNEAVDGLLRQFRLKDKNTWLYRLESHWPSVVLSLIVVIAAVALFTVYGVPATAKLIAANIPDTWVEKAGQQTLLLLDDEMMVPSELDAATQQRVTQYFSQIMAEHDNIELKLLFRDSDVGPNAFALPDGSIIFTDDMILLAENDDELLSVMAHEVAHVIHRHGLRSVIQGSMIGFGFMLFTGDVSGATELFLGIPLVLTHLGYSRSFEREADDYALAYMIDNNIDPAHFSRLMTRVERAYCTNPSFDNSDDVDDPMACEPEADWQRYWSTHPGLEERIQKFENAL